MSYTDPAVVLSPKRRMKNLNVKHDGGEGEWALAEMEWDGKPAVGIRWNGSTEDPKTSDKGNPQSSGHPTWFILPDEIAWETLALVLKLKKEGKI